MPLSEQSFNRLIGLAYDGLESLDAWRSFYEELRLAIDAKSIHMLCLDKRHGTLSYSDGANLPVQGELAYVQHYRFIDPRMPRILERPPLAWFHCHETLDENFVATDPFYQEFLIPYDRRYLSACKLVDTDQATIVFASMRGREDGPLSEEAIAFLDRLLPHLSRACRIGMQNFIYSSQALVGHTLVDRLRQPLILMTPGGEVIHTNKAADKLLQSTKLVQIDNGRLKLPARSQQELLNRCAELEQQSKQGSMTQADASGNFESLLISPNGRMGEEHVYGFFTMLAPKSTMGAFGLRPVVLLFFFHPDSETEIDSSLLMAAFGLTPAECRVASALAEGWTLKQIADMHGTRPETVRKHLQAIFHKTATNRQPELIRLLLHLPHNALAG